VGILSGLRARLRALFRRTSADRELNEEIHFHIELETEKNMRLGYARDEARRLAVSHFGGVQRVREEHRDVRRLQWIEDFIADGRFALRSLRRTPALAGAAIITLALGIGANVAIFSAVNAVVLRPLPFPSPDRLMMITEENPEKHWHLNVSAPANLLDWREGVADLENIAGYVDSPIRSTLTGRGDPQQLTGTYVTGNFFSTLGVHAAMGRVFREEESWLPARPAGQPDTRTHVAMLSDRAWRDRFGADPTLVGKSIVLDGISYQVVGITPPGFSFPLEGFDLYRSVEWDPASRGADFFRRAHWLRAVARLKPGVTEAHANAQLQAVVERLKHDYPGTNKYMGAAMMPLHDYLVGDTRLPLLILLTSVAFLLLIACANVGNLLLVQAAGREREASLRLALGAGRGRLVRQAIAESLALSLLGGACGLAAGWAGTHALVRLQPDGLLTVSDFGVDRAVLAYVVLISLASGLIFGVAPAFWARHRDPAESLKSGGRAAGHGGGARRWGNMLVVSEVALALLMTVGAGLLVRSFWQVRHVDPGFDSHGVLTVRVGLSRLYDSSSKIIGFQNQLLERARAIPGVTNVAITTSLPLTGPSYTSDFIAYGRPAGGYGTEVSNRTVSSEYFAALRVPLKRGRVFTNEDRQGSVPLLVINEALAQSYFKGQDPVGQRLSFDKVPTSKTTWYTIIGVVGNEHVDALDRAPRPEVFHSLLQEPYPYFTLVLRTNGEPASVTPAVRDIIRGLDPTLALARITTLDRVRDESMARVRFLTTMLLGFAVIGLVLSVVGVYGVLAQVSRNRTREMGIRIALGAQAGRVRWLVVRQGLRLTIAGLALGTVGAVLSTRLMAKLLFQVTPTDPATLIGVSLLLAATSILAAWIPALNASRADPAVALRSD
jgi:putative ABC transport system permease protein